MIEDLRESEVLSKDMSVSISIYMHIYNVREHLFYSETDTE